AALAPTRAREVRNSQTPIGSSRPHAQLRDLARAARARVLVALAAGLRVVEGTDAVVHDFGLIELLLVGLVGGVVDHPITPAVEACWGFRRGGRLGSECQGNTDHRRSD